MRQRPAVVFSQNPSIFLVLLLLAVRPFFGYKLVSDAHYAGVVACNGSGLLQRVLDTCNRVVDLVIVTTLEHADYVSQLGGKAVVCEDPLPDLPCYGPEDAVEEKMVFFICSFDVDEPYRNVFQAAGALARDGFRLCVTGNYVKAGIDPAAFQSVVFYGYLPDADYHRKLFSSSLVVDLTENENCLVCGAYEAMAAEKPLVTSNTNSLRRFFNKGTVFTDHDVDSILVAVRCAYENRDRLKSEIVQWKTEILAAQQYASRRVYDALLSSERSGTPSSTA